MDGRSLDELYEDIENDGYLVTRMWEEVQENAHNWEHEAAHEYAGAMLDDWMSFGQVTQYEGPIVSPWPAEDELDEDWWD